MLDAMSGSEDEEDDNKNVIDEELDPNLMNSLGLP